MDFQPDLCGFHIYLRSYSMDGKMAEIRARAFLALVEMERPATVPEKPEGGG